MSIFRKKGIVDSKLEVKVMDRLNLQVDHVVHVKLKALAKKYRLSVSAIVRKALDQYLTGQGIG